MYVMILYVIILCFTFSATRRLKGFDGQQESESEDEDDIIHVSITNSHNKLSQNSIVDKISHVHLSSPIVV